MAKYKHYFLVFAGAGHYEASIKMRVSFNDIKRFDTLEMKWNTEVIGLSGSYIPQKRMSHSGDTLGTMLVTYGGFNTEGKQALSDV